MQCVIFESWIKCLALGLFFVFAFFFFFFLALPATCESSQARDQSHDTAVIRVPVLGYRVKSENGPYDTILSVLHFLGRMAELWLCRMMSCILFSQDIC